MSETPSIRGVDFHCHLDLYPDHAAAVAKAEAARIYTLTVTTTPRAWARNHELTRHTHYVRAALGLHPQLVAERADELSLWERHLPEARYVGEIGLDAGPRFHKSLEAQKQVFQRILVRCAEAGGKILTVHSVRSVPAVLDMIEAHLPTERGTVVLHWFTGSKSEARRAAALGCYFSINAEMTRTDRGRDLIASIPRNRILTETDGPFTHIQGRATEPSDAPLAADILATILGLSPDDMAKVVVTNLRSLLS
ncbi:TatD DNase family protein [Rhizobium sp. PP-WC-1G-195]|nr:TatD DNase family protein [Rhizobium sp. PP-WC-1G-195]